MVKRSTSLKRPLLVGIGASNSGAGKTTLACAILRRYTRKRTGAAGTPRWGAIKYTGSSAIPAVVTARRTLEEPGKDTARLLASGAAGVVWVRSSRAGLPSVLPGALKKLSSCEVIVVEGNGAIEFLKPDIVLFIFGKKRREWKPGIEKMARTAAIVLREGKQPAGVDRAGAHVFQKALPEGRELRRFFRFLTGLLNERRHQARDAQQGGQGKTLLRSGPQDR